MAVENNIELIIHVDSNKITYQYSKTNGEERKYPADEYQEETIRVELQVARTFHKILNYLYLKKDFVEKEDKDIFQKEDFEILGEMLRKILYGKFGAAVVEDIVFNLLELAKGAAKCRIYLEFEKNCELAVLPWEYTVLKDNKNKSIYLAANKDKNFDLIRRIDASGNLRMIDTKKLNCVLIVSSQKNKTSNDDDIPAIGDDEVELVTGLFDELKANYPARFDYQTLVNPEFENLSKELEEAVSKFETNGGDPPPYVIHYLGHSSFRNDEGKIVFLREDKNSHWIRDAEFAQVFDSRNLDFGSPQMFTLQSCDSAKLSTYGRGVALSLVNQKIPAILGMQNEVDTATSTQFMKKFYEALLQGNDVGEAVTIGRTFLGKGEEDAQGKYLKSESGWYKTNSFGSPVLFITTLKPIYFFEKTTQLPQDNAEKNVLKKCSVCKNEFKVPVGQTNCIFWLREPGRPERVCNGLLYEIAPGQETGGSAISEAKKSTSAAGATVAATS